MRPIKNRCDLSYYTSQFSICRTQSFRKSDRQTISSVRFYLCRRGSGNGLNQYFRLDLYYFGSKISVTCKIDACHIFMIIIIDKKDEYNGNDIKVRLQFCKKIL